MIEEAMLLAPVVIVAEACDRGKEREENQDAVRHAMLPLGELLLVADGVGGYSGGATASRMVVECFLECLGTLPSDYPADQAIREASAHANASINAAANAPGSPYSRMGSTVVMALLSQNPSQGPSSQAAAGSEATEIRAWIGHVGDSRAYLMRDGRLTRITNDHSAMQSLLNRNLITPEQAQNHPDASVLTRSLGHRPEVEIDIEMVSLAVGDSLLLCSDGLWGYVPEPELERVMADPNLTEPAAAAALVDLALAAGGHDNIGLEIARVSLPPASAQPAEPEPARKGRGGLFFTIAVLILAALGTFAWAYLTHRLPGFWHLR